MRSQIIFSLCLTLIFLQVCNRIDVNDIEKNLENPEPYDTSRIERNVLVEYFSGHYCGNCPSNSGPALDEIDRLFSGRAIVMAIHAGFFATPSLTPDNLDLTSEAGNNLYNDAGVSGLPVGRINRMTYNNSLLLNPSVWSSAAAVFLDSISPAELSLSSFFDSSTFTGSATVTVEFYRPPELTYSTSLYIVEDSIVGYQVDFSSTPELVPNWVFNHVLRMECLMVTPQNADILPSGTEKRYSKTFNYSIQNDWNFHKCSFIILLIEKDTGAVVQTDIQSISG